MSSTLPGGESIRQYYLYRGVSEALAGQFKPRSAGVYVKTTEWRRDVADLYRRLIRPHHAEIRSTIAREYLQDAASVALLVDRIKESRLMHSLFAGEVRVDESDRSLLLGNFPSNVHDRIHAYLLNADSLGRLGTAMVFHLSVDGT